MTTKEDLRRLLEELPDSELDAARRFLEYLRDTTDPLMRKLSETHEEEEELNDETSAALREAKEEASRGEGRPWKEVRTELGRG